MEPAARRPSWLKPTPARVLTEIHPHSEWVHGREFDKLVMDVTGFSRDQLKVNVEPSGSLKVSGERDVDDDGGGGRQRCHFTKRFDLPTGCVVNDGAAAAITVKVDQGKLYIQVPRVTSSTEQQPASAEVDKDDALVPGGDETTDALLPGEDETSDGHGGGGNFGRVAARRDGEHSFRRFGRGLMNSRHRQVILNVVVLAAAVLLWLVAFAKNKPGSGQGKND